MGICSGYSYGQMTFYHGAAVVATATVAEMRLPVVEVVGQGGGGEVMILQMYNNCSAVVRARFVSYYFVLFRFVLFGDFREPSIRTRRLPDS